MKRLALSLTVALLISSGAVPAAADTTIEVDQMIDAVMVAENPCIDPPETVLLTGFIHIVGPVTQDAGGTVTMRYHLNSHFDGVGLTTGHKYVLDEEQNTRTTFVASVPDKIWMTTGYKLINQTSADNFEVIIVFRETVPGLPVIKQADSACRG